MDVFKAPGSQPYRLGEIFSMPTSTGGVPAIAVSDTGALYLLSTYTFLVILISTTLWKICVNLTLRFYPTRSKLRGNRYVTIAGVGSAGGAWGAAILMGKYCWTMFVKARDTRSGALAMPVFVVAVLLCVARIAAGIVIPTYLVIGQVAPVDASFVFFPPELDLEKPSPRMMFFRAIVQNSAHLAVAYLANVQETLLTPGPNQRVSINFTDLPTTTKGDSLRIDYRYEITGVDLGLQNAGELAKTVSGSCDSIYDFFSNDDDWRLIAGADPPIGLAPAVYFRYEGEDFRYLVAPNATGILSVGQSDDIWYATGNSSQVEGDVTVYSVLPERPLLSCLQRERWTYGAGHVSGNTSLEHLPGLHLKPILRNYLEHPLNRLSPIVLMPVFFGDRMLLSASTAIVGLFDASFYNVRQEMSRLIALSFLFETDMLRRTVTNSVFRTKYPNPVFVNGTKVDGVDDFVIRSSEVATISLKTLVSVPVVLFILGLILMVLETRACVGRNGGSSARYQVRQIAFRPMQMYRHIDEARGGSQAWKGRTSEVPYIVHGNSDSELPEGAESGSDDQSSHESARKDSSSERRSSFVAPKVVERYGRTPRVDIEFTRVWDPDLNVRWGEVGNDSDGEGTVIHSSFNFTAIKNGRRGSN